MNFKLQFSYKEIITTVSVLSCAVSLPKFICWNPNLNVTVFTHIQCVIVSLKRSFKEAVLLKWGHKSGPWSNLTAVLIRRRKFDTETRGAQVHTGKTTWRHSEQPLFLQSKERGFRRNQASRGHLFHGLLASRGVKNMGCLSHHSVESCYGSSSKLIRSTDFLIEFYRYCISEIVFSV